MHFSTNTLTDLALASPRVIVPPLHNLSFLSKPCSSFPVNHHFTCVHQAAWLLHHRQLALCKLLASLPPNFLSTYQYYLTLIDTYPVCCSLLRHYWQPPPLFPHYRPLPTNPFLFAAHHRLNIFPPWPHPPSSHRKSSPPGRSPRVVRRSRQLSKVSLQTVPAKPAAPVLVLSLLNGALLKSQGYTEKLKYSLGVQLNNKSRWLSTEVEKYFRA